MFYQDHRIALDAYDATCKHSVMVYRKTDKVRESTINLRVTAGCRKRLEELAYRWSEPGNTCHMVDALERSIDLAYANDKTKLRRVK